LWHNKNWLKQQESSDYQNALKANDLPSTVTAHPLVELLGFSLQSRIMPRPAQQNMQVFGYAFIVEALRANPKLEISSHDEIQKIFEDKSWEVSRAEEERRKRRRVWRGGGKVAGREALMDLIRLVWRWNQRNSVFLHIEIFVQSIVFHIGIL